MVLVLGMVDASLAFSLPLQRSFSCVESSQISCLGNTGRQGARFFVFEIPSKQRLNFSALQQRCYALVLAVQPEVIQSHASICTSKSNIIQYVYSICILSEKIGSSHNLGWNGATLECCDWEVHEARRGN